MSAPKVSVVVPNFNHEQFLTRRLESIYGQTFQDFEVILLDDASIDGSLEILRTYVTRYPERTRLLVNTTNSGSPFAQWAKGIEAARGELVWIAETDDYATPELLQKLVDPFNNPGVVLAYATPIYVGPDGCPTAFQFDDYVGVFDSHRWKVPYITDGSTEVSQAMGIRNTIPNASAALFRAEAARPHIGDPLLHKMRICGDWCFYLRLLATGKVAYVGKAASFYTFHDQSCSYQQARAPGYLSEHSMVVAVLRALFPTLPLETLRRNFECLLSHFRWVSGQERPAVVSNWQAVEFCCLWEMEDALSTALTDSREKEARISSLSNRLSSLEDKQAATESALRAAQIQLEGTTADLEAILASSSWRMTKPLRDAIDAIRGMRDSKVRSARNKQDTSSC